MSPAPSWHQIVNATSVAVDNAGVLLTGGTGSGKSDLALRLIDAGASLIADDVTELHSLDGRLNARFPLAAPAGLQGRMEVRGLGILPVRVVAGSVPLILVAELVAPEMIERMPLPLMAKYGDFDVALVKLAPFEASAVAKLRLAVAVAGGHIMAPL
ncbi:MAG TPA: HPr kinase/phosphatase C-terminal domain-containing protein [Dongiaceae bacterium]